MSNSKPACDYEAALEKIASGHPSVICAVRDNFPSPYEIDVGDESAILRLLQAIVAAGRVQ